MRKALLRHRHVEWRSLLAVPLDLDFAIVQAHPPGTHAGIIVFRSKSQDELTLISLLKRMAPVLKRGSPEGQLWIVQPERIRYQKA